MVAKFQEFTSSWPAKVSDFVAYSRVFALIDPAVEAKLKITNILTSRRLALTSFTEFPPNPSWEVLASSVAAAKAAKAQCVLAIGGGTAIDLAKLTAMALQLGGIEPLWNAAQGGREIARDRSDIPLMAIPTTAGTGSEATRFAVLYRDGIKLSITGDGLKPDAWVLDPSLLTTLPSPVIADAGLDAACQAMESLWSVRSTQESEEHAWQALDLAVEHLEPAVRLTNNDALAGMLVSAHLAGKAIDVTTTTAPHALSYGLTSLLGLPHGRAVAMLFGSIFRLNASLPAGNCPHPNGPTFLGNRLADIADRWGQSLHNFPDWWDRFIHKELRLPTLPSASNAKNLTDQLMASVNATRLANNPRFLAPEDIRQIYQSLICPHVHGDGL